MDSMLDRDTRDVIALAKRSMRENVFVWTPGKEERVRELLAAAQRATRVDEAMAAARAQGEFGALLAKGMEEVVKMAGDGETEETKALRLIVKYLGYIHWKVASIK